MSIKSKARTYFRKIRRMKIGLTFPQAAKLGKLLAQDKKDSDIIVACEGFVEVDRFDWGNGRVFVYGEKSGSKDLDEIRRIVNCDAPFLVE